MRRSWTMAGMIAAITISLASVVAAEELRVGYAEGSMRKLGRGVANVATGPLELIRTPSLVNEREGWIAGLTVGITQGISAMVVRELAGALEVATFFIPIPKHFKPIVTPEFVFQDGKWTS